jgi:hypothetical protein
MNLQLIEKQLEILNEIVFNIGRAESRLEDAKKSYNLGIYKWLYSIDKRNNDIDTLEKALDRWKQRYIVQLEVLNELSYHIKNKLITKN